MNKFPLVSALLVAFAGSVVAQDQSREAAYRVDNFDLPNAVRIHVPAPPTSKQSPRRRLVTSNNLNYSLASVPLTHPTSMAVGNTLGAFTTGDANIDSFIVDSGRRNSVDPLLLYSIMHQESTFKPRAMSNKGARGLMQLMPGTAQRFGVSSIWDPRQNIEGGTRYVRFLLDKFGGDVELALAGYNAGEGAVIKYGNRIPPYSETQEYVRRISRRYDLIRDPLSTRYANSYTREQLASVQKESAPLTMYEPSVFAARLPDGRLQLISR